MSRRSRRGRRPERIQAPVRRLHRSDKHYEATYSHLKKKGGLPGGIPPPGRWGRRARVAPSPRARALEGPELVGYTGNRYLDATVLPVTSKRNAPHLDPCRALDGRRPRIEPRGGSGASRRARREYWKMVAARC